MWFSRRRAALRASSVLWRLSRPAIVEELESRELLDANDPVIVFNAPFSLIRFADVNSATVTPHLWNNPGGEVAWNLDDYASHPWTDTTHDHDYDGDGYHDDIYGWNFTDNTPNFIDNTLDGHNSLVTVAALNGIIDVATVDGQLGTSLASHIKIMWVIGTMDAPSAGGMSPALQYVMDKKNAFLNGQPGGANIVAVAHSFLSANTAKVLQTRDILDFDWSGNAAFPGNKDAAVGNSDIGAVAPGFDRATPSKYIQEPPVESIIPTTIEPNPNDAETENGYGINSYYFAVGGRTSTSFTVGRAAVYAAAAVASYQANHSGASPGWQEVKRALMSGVRFDDPHMDNPPRTITHDYDATTGQRKGGGLIDATALPSVYTAINTTTPAVAITSIEPTLTDPFGTEVKLSLRATGSVSNWTINWGDNTDSEVIPGTAPGQPATASHTYNTSTLHHYFPTAYAVSASNGQVYLASPAVEAGAQAKVVVNALLPTSGKDDYTVSRSGDTVTLSRNAFSENLDAGSFTLTLPLGAGGDTATIDYSGGDPLEGVSNPTITAATGAGGVKIIGSSSTTTGDSITVGAASGGNRTVTVDGDAITVSTAVAGFTLAGGVGNDTLDAGSADVPVSLQGDAGNDSLTGGSGSDSLQGGAGNDTLTGGLGYDRTDYSGASLAIYVTGLVSSVAVSNPDYSEIDNLHGVEDIAGTSANDIFITTMTVHGGAGNDYVIDSDSAEGGAGNDTLIGYGGADTFYGNDGNDSITGDAGNDSLDGGNGSDTISGGDGDDLIVAGATGDGNNTVSGDAGNDFLYGGSASDVMNGGAGNDTLFSGSGTGPESGNNSLDGGTGDDFVFAQGGANTLNGGDGDDVISGTFGLLLQVGGVLMPGTVAPLISGGAGNATISGGTGSSTMNGDDGNDVIYAGVGEVSVDGGAGNDTIYGTRLFDPDPYVVIIHSVGGVYVNDLIGVASGTSITLDGGTGIDSVVGGADAESILGSDGNDTIDAGAGDDTIDGGGGSDTVSAGDGDDLLRGGGGDDTLDGGDGWNVFDYSNAAAGVSLTSTFDGDSQQWIVSGDDGDGGTDLLTNVGEVVASSHNDTIAIGSGAIDGGPGDDLLSGTQVNGGSGADTITGTADNDYLSGDDGNDAIYGDDGDDTIYGGAGDDYLQGGRGNDEIHGDDDNDQLSWNNDGDTDTLDGGAGIDSVSGSDQDGDTLDVLIDIEYT